MRSVGLEARPTSGVFSIYSAGIGQKALDGLPGDSAERNSVFTRVFIKKLREPGRHLADVMEDVKEDVSRLAASVIDPGTRQGHRQFPAYYNETQGGRVYIAGRPANTELPKTPVQTAPPASAPAADEALWAVVKDSNVAAMFEEFLKRHPGSRHADEAKSKLRQLQPPSQTAVVAPPPSGPAPDIAAITGPALPGRAAGRKGQVLIAVGKPRKVNADEITLPDLVKESAAHGVPPAVATGGVLTAVHKLPGGWISLRRDDTATIYDTQGRVAASIPLTPYFDKSPHRDSGIDFKRGVEDAHAAGGVLYFNVGCALTYSRVFGGKCSYLVALDIATRKVLWQSADLTSTRDFIFAGGVLITGYGFTDEKDYIHAIDPATGKTLQKTLVDSTPIKMEIVGDRLRMISYNDRLYVFQIN